MISEPRRWKANPMSPIVTRPGDPPHVLGLVEQEDGFPDIWQTANGDYVVVGTDVTEAYDDRLPDSVHRAEYERIVMIPAVTFNSAAHR